MKIKINDEKRILAYCKAGEIEGGIEVNSLPEGNYIDYKYINGQYVYDKYTETLSKEAYYILIDTIKEKALQYGFDYKINEIPHRQRCRDKDIAFIGTSMTYLMGENMIGNTTATTPWYFEDNFEHQFNLQELVVFARYGKTFIESVYKTENYFKTLETTKKITKEEFENKRKEFHIILVRGI